MTTTVGSGKYTYEMDPDWAQVPEGWEMPAAAVAVDSKDRVFAYTRQPDHPVMIFERDGTFVSAWGDGYFEFAHAIYIDVEDNVWLVDRDRGQVFKFTNDGKLLMTIGERGFRSNTGADPTDWGSEGYRKVVRGGEPFNLPAGIALNAEGDIFISDGYANARVHRFSPEGELRFSWGEPGDGPGQFNLPHGIWIDKDGRVLVADRENDRVQVFTQEGEYVSTWPTELVGPGLFCVDDDGVVYIPEHNGGFTSITTLDGERLARWGSKAHRGAHGVWVDSHKDFYVVEPGDWDKRRVVKFTRKG